MALRVSQVEMTRSTNMTFVGNTGMVGVRVRSELKVMVGLNRRLKEKLGEDCSDSAFAYTSSSFTFIITFYIFLRTFDLDCFS